MMTTSPPLGPGEQLVITLHTHPRVLVPVVVTAVTFAVAGLLVPALLGLSGVQPKVALVCLGAAAVMLGITLWNWRSTAYYLTDRRLITRQGILSRSGHDIPLARVTDVAYEMDILDRLFGCGSLIFASASTRGQVPLHDVPQVEKVLLTLNRLRRKLQHQ